MSVCEMTITNYIFNEKEIQKNYYLRQTISYTSQYHRSWPPKVMLNQELDWEVNTLPRV